MKDRPGKDVLQIPVHGGIIPDNVVDGLSAVHNDQQKAQQPFLEDLGLFVLAQCLVDVSAVVQQCKGKPGGGL